jgi:ribosomal protein S18 acetylase RimI-like enzyme
MNNFEFVNGGTELLDSVQPLWEKLNKYHESKSIYFKDVFKNFTFETRKSKFISNDNISVNIDLIKDMNSDSYIGYCISTLDKHLSGEIDSLFIDEKYHGFGLGDNLMKRALLWLDSNHAVKKVIGVASGNEGVLDFYKHYGFYKRSVILEQKAEQIND